MFRKKFVEKTETRFLPKIVTFERSRWKIWYSRRRISEVTHTHTHTHSLKMCNTYCFSTATIFRRTPPHCYLIHTLPVLLLTFLILQSYHDLNDTFVTCNPFEAILLPTNTATNQPCIIQTIHSCIQPTQ